MISTTRTVTARALAVVGTVLVGVPLTAPFALAAVRFAFAGDLRVDVLIPGELFAVVFLGGATLLAGSFIADRLSMVVGATAATGVVLFGVTAWISDSTGLASGAAEPAGWPLILLSAAYALYVGAVIGLFAVGVALCRSTFGLTPVAGPA